MRYCLKALAALTDTTFGNSLPSKCRNRRGMIEIWGGHGWPVWVPLIIAGKPCTKEMGLSLVNSRPTSDNTDKAPVGE